MSKIPNYEGPAFPLSSPIEELIATCTAPYNHRAVGFRNCESAFHLAGTILSGRDIIEEFVAANIWPISYGWAPTEIVTFNVNWAAQEVPFPRFGIQLPKDQSTDDFMNEIEKKVNAMIGESCMNEYKAFKNLVKHKKTINRVFSEVCGDKSFHSRRPGIKKKALAVVIASCSAGPPKLLEDHLRRNGRQLMMELLLLLCALRRLDLLSPANESIGRLRLFQMLNFRLPLVLLDLAERR
jgi:uncharacterized protein YktA (UPF0223 family)